MGEMQLRKVIVLTLILFCRNLTGLHAQAVKDADGNIYMTITIGTQVWIAENLKTTKFNDGKEILLVTDEKKWKELKTPAYCLYKNDGTNKDIYGALYNWQTVKTGKLCPKGWHVPTAKEWQILVEFLGDVSLAGDKLKETGTAHWKNINGSATNDFDFTALPGGMRLASGIFPAFGDSYAIWWSSTEYNSYDAWNCGLHDTSSGVFHGHDNKQSGFSVRCMRD